MQDSTLRVAIFSGIWECIKHKCFNIMYVLNDQLHTMEICTFHGIKIQVEGVDGERISQMCCCTGSPSWGGGDQPYNRVWVKHCLRRCNGMLNQCLPMKLQRLFKIPLQCEDRAFVEYWLALAITTVPENYGNFESILNLYN